MKKIIVLLLVLLCACDAAKNSNQQSWRVACQDIGIKNNRVLIDLEIQGQLHPFVLRFGSTSSICDTALPGIIGIKSGNNSQVAIKVANNLLSDNATFAISSAPRFPDAIGIFGYNILSQNKMGYQLDFDNNQICQLSKEKLKDFAQNSGYKEIRSKFNSGGFSIFITIRKKPYEFQFDTAYPGTFKLAYNENIPFIKEANKK